MVLETRHLISHVECCDDMPGCPAADYPVFLESQREKRPVDTAVIGDLNKCKDITKS